MNVIDYKELREAAELAIKSGKVSTSLLQREMRIGYSKSARMIEGLEEMGIIGAQNGSSPREVLVTLDQIDEIFAEHKPKMVTEEAKSVTIMKYLGTDGKYHFIVKDKFDIADEVERLDFMNNLRDHMMNTGEMKKHLWTKETVLF